MKILGIDHVAICTPDNDQAARPFLDFLGLAMGPREFVEAQKTDACFLLTAEEAGACVELITPKGGNPGLEKFLAKRGPGLHHIAFRVDDLAAALQELDARGVPLIDRVPRPGARGHRVGFLHPSAAGGTLVELVGH
ncbi:MAG TPA: VOC family protein [Polyangia bacterium]|jgi:methylmalonyl-CoA/ethylmalonyl-CoA epimerase|nr:VOC family protein [Polyangia bacterium]